MGTVRAVATLFLGVLALTACSNEAVSAAAAPVPARAAAPVPARAGTPVPGAELAHPRGLVAIGHSGLTGVYSDPLHPEANALQNSWATGTSPQVDSIYQRLVVALPETGGHVVNAAVNGSRASALSDQAASALLHVPAPALVLVQTIVNDIACDGSDARRIPVFGTEVRKVLDTITTASPLTQIVIVSVAGRPAEHAAALASDRGASGRLAATRRCSLFTGPGRVDPAGVAMQTRLVEAYEAEVRRVCAEVPQCHTDGGALASYEHRRQDLAWDLRHYAVSGQRRFAELVWPTVAEVLGLR
jgi:lysophospholipase L1-like esterase